MFDKLPIEIIIYIKSFINFWEFFINEQNILKIEHYLQQQPYQYYYKINLKNKYNLRWKRLYPNENKFYYRHQKKKFKYFIAIQDDLIHTITIYPQWKNKFSDTEYFIMDEYFYSSMTFYSDLFFFTNVNKSFTELIFFNNNIIQCYLNSPLMLFQKLDQLVYRFQNDLEQRLFKNM